MSVAHVLLFFRVSIALMFAAAAVGKLSARRDFELAIEGFRVVRGRRATRMTANAVLAAELAIVALLAVGGPLLLPGFALAAGLLTAFSLLLIRTLARGIEVSCNCFGPGVRPISPADVVRNVVMIFAAVAGAVALRLDHDQPVTGGQVALLVAMGAVFVLVTSNLADIVTGLRAPL
jgi:methylamine utilization protein MauE